MKISAFVSKPFGQVNKIKQNNEKKQLAQYSSCNSLPHCYMDKSLLNVSFKGETLQGPKTEINLFEFKEELAELHKEITKVKSQDEKIKLFESTPDLLHGFLKNWNDENQNYLNKTEQEMWGDFRHELDNEYSYPYLEYILKGHMQNKEDIPSIDDVSKDMFKNLYKTTKRYKFFMERGLSSHSQNLPEMMKLVLKPEKEHLENRNIKLKIKGKKLLKNEKIKFKLTDYEAYIVLRNITQNASKYSFDNSTIKIKFDLDKEKTLLNVSVEDEGVGINPEEFENVKEGERGTNAKESKIAGSGIGLKRVVKILREKAGQEIEIESPLNSNPPKGKGKGARMSFSIPIEIED